MIRLIIDLAQLEGTESVLDIYCGGGLITLPLAKRARDATGIEINPQSVKDARATAERNGIKNVRFIAADAFTGTKEIHQADILVVDPPRAGCSLDLLNWIMDEGQGPLDSKRLIYVSCNPATFIRDARILVKRGARLRQIYPVDMFPMTFHVEIVAQFDLRLV